ncbi:hypothetical protein PSECIP111951_03665 [Pseudoalteromonas holothuriae]|uniref:Uncharacterized protein n=1 Tax=Pseudoalteromonas holothuriae TaxID=2963714 RepID=A0A9W4R1F2_9GAMM|nr:MULTISPECIES: hypothetical protein [unclassified Pseudoalteromonas]CAH9062408.1 hypothetical protein PSECIP111854_03006 [Pseudoalteromonas sp. CIP111854]CAH9066886.1 hypothetical protein PSECIP111951_03665 [Pseudoalteromonas sp. CIP111951]
MAKITRKLSNNKHQSRDFEFIIAALNELKVHPEKLEIIKTNCAEFKQQPYLKRGLLLAVERFEWVFAIDDDVQRIAKQVLADDYIGNRLRRYPLLFKGVICD